jgi:hypothetical protein
MKQLNASETETLAALLKRAIANSQLNLHVASPYAEGEDWKKDGWDWNDRHDGNSYTSNDWHVESVDSSGEDPETGKEYNRPEICIYVDDTALCSLTGILPEEADAVTAARRARASRAGKSRSAKKTKAARKNWKRAVKTLKGKDA